MGELALAYVSWATMATWAIWFIWWFIHTIIHARRRERERLFFKTDAFLRRVDQERDRIVDRLLISDEELAVRSYGYTRWMIQADIDHALIEHEAKRALSQAKDARS